VLGEISWDGFAEEVELFVIESPRHPLVLGYQWFKKNNPRINWSTGEITKHLP
jgi:predicted aspartyl protease